ncbi:MAG: aspartate aminotransferase family protein [Thermoproteota archaeon]
MIEEEIKRIEQKRMADVYWKRPIVITKGKGATVWDIHGKQYIDCTGSYGVALVGHSHPKIVEAITHQAKKLISCHGTFYNDTRSELLKKITYVAPRGLTDVFLGNSGSEAVECALKLSRKFTGKPEIIAMVGGFHGKTMGALSATWKQKYRRPFQPLIPGFKHFPRYNIKKLKSTLTDKTAAVIVEPIQGEGGVRIPPQTFLQELTEICQEKGVLSIFDEVQTGFGRTGKMFACEHWGVTPDIICLAKSVAGGLPLGITLARHEIMSSLGIGEHTTTFGGNPLVCASACAAIDILKEEKLPERAAEMGRYFKEKLEVLKDRYKIIRDVRGLGLMIGIELRFSVLNIILNSMDQGVLLLDAGRNILRLLPPLVIERQQIDTVISVLDGVLREEEHERLRR